MKLVILTAALLLAPLALAPAAVATHPCFGPDCGIPHEACPVPTVDWDDLLGWLKAWLACRP